MNHLNSHSSSSPSTESQTTKNAFSNDTPSTSVTSPCSICHALQKTNQFHRLSSFPSNLHSSFLFAPAASSIAGASHSSLSAPLVTSPTTSPTSTCTHQKTLSPASPSFLSIPSTTDSKILGMECSETFVPDCDSQSSLPSTSTFSFRNQTLPGAFPSPPLHNNHCVSPQASPTLQEPGSNYQQQEQRYFKRQTQHLDFPGQFPKSCNPVQPQPPTTSTLSSLLMPTLLQPPDQPLNTPIANRLQPRVEGPQNNVHRHQQTQTLQKKTLSRATSCPVLNPSALEKKPSSTFQSKENAVADSPVLKTTILSPFSYSYSSFTWSSSSNGTSSPDPSFSDSNKDNAEFLDVETGFTDSSVVSFPPLSDSVAVSLVSSSCSSFHSVPSQSLGFHSDKCLATSTPSLSPTSTATAVPLFSLMPLIYGRARQEVQEIEPVLQMEPTADIEYHHSLRPRASTSAIGAPVLSRNLRRQSSQPEFDRNGRPQYTRQQPLPPPPVPSWANQHQEEEEQEQQQHLHQQEEANARTLARMESATILKDLYSASDIKQWNRDVPALPPILPAGQGPDYLSVNSPPPPPQAQPFSSLFPSYFFSSSASSSVASTLSTSGPKSPPIVSPVSPYASPPSLHTLSSPCQAEQQPQQQPYTHPLHPPTLKRQRAMTFSQSALPPFSISESMHSSHPNPPATPSPSSSINHSADGQSNSNQNNNNNNINSINNNDDDNVPLIAPRPLRGSVSALFHSLRPSAWRQPHRFQSSSTLDFSRHAKEFYRPPPAIDIFNRPLPALPPEVVFLNGGTGGAISSTLEHQSQSENNGTFNKSLPPPPQPSPPPPLLSSLSPQLTPTTESNNGNTLLSRLVEFAKFDKTRRKSKTKKSPHPQNTTSGPSTTPFAELQTNLNRPRSSTSPLSTSGSPSTNRNLFQISPSLSLPIDTIIDEIRQLFKTTPSTTSNSGRSLIQFKDRFIESLARQQHFFLAANDRYESFGALLSKFPSPPDSFPPSLSNASSTSLPSPTTITRRETRARPTVNSHQLFADLERVLSKAASTTNLGGNDWRSLSGHGPGSQSETRQGPMRAGGDYFESDDDLEDEEEEDEEDEEERAGLIDNSNNIPGNSANSINPTIPHNIFQNNDNSTSHNGSNSSLLRRKFTFFNLAEQFSSSSTTTVTATTTPKLSNQKQSTIKTSISQPILTATSRTKTISTREWHLRRLRQDLLESSQRVDEVFEKYAQSQKVLDNLLAPLTMMASCGSGSTTAGQNHINNNPDDFGMDLEEVDQLLQQYSESKVWSTTASHVERARGAAAMATSNNNTTHNSGIDDNNNKAIGPLTTAPQKLTKKISLLFSSRSSRRQQPTTSSSTVSLTNTFKHTPSVPNLHSSSSSSTTTRRQQQHSLSPIPTQGSPTTATTSDSLPISRSVKRFPSTMFSNLSLISLSFGKEKAEDQLRKTSSSATLAAPTMINHDHVDNPLGIINNNSSTTMTQSYQGPIRHRLAKARLEFEHYEQKLLAADEEMLDDYRRYKRAMMAMEE